MLGNAHLNNWQPARPRELWMTRDVTTIALHNPELDGPAPHETDVPVPRSSGAADAERGHVPQKARHGL